MHLPCLLQINSRLVIILRLVINLVHLCFFGYLLHVLEFPLLIVFLEFVDFLEVDRLVEFLNLLDYFGLTLLDLLFFELELSIELDEERGLDPSWFNHQPLLLLLLVSLNPKLCLLPVILLHLIQLQPSLFPFVLCL
jgi:hypothetical protein